MVLMENLLLQTLMEYCQPKWISSHPVTGTYMYRATVVVKRFFVCSIFQDLLK